MKDEQVFRVVQAALASARSIHPVWPKDIVHAAAVVAEESGELVQAALQVQYENGQIERTFEEAVHVIVTAVRFLTEGESVPKQYSFPHKMNPIPGAARFKKKPELVVSIRFDPTISFWSALKLRLAGQNFRPVVDELLDQIRNADKQYPPPPPQWNP